MKIFKIEIMEQRTDEWFKARIGLVTASRVSEILGKKGLGLTGESYARDLALKVLFPDYDDENFTNADMQRGIENEPLAFDWFKRQMEANFSKVEECGFYKFNDHLGASPDGFVDDDAILEIKCPRFSQFLKTVENNEVPPNYYAQMQLQMLATNRTKGYFVSYAVVNGVEYGHIIEVSQDKPLQELIISRAKETIEIRDRIIKDLQTKLKLN